MLTIDQQEYFFKLYKNTFYSAYKLEIEASLTEIEKPEVRKQRDLLLREAEHNAAQSARKIVREIKNKTIEELKTIINSSQNKDFGDSLLSELENEIGDEVI